MAQSPDTRRARLIQAGHSTHGLLSVLNTREQAMIKITRPARSVDDTASTPTSSFSQSELDKFYEAFRAASPDGRVVTLAEFTKVFQAMGITDPMVIEHTFHAWDLNKDGTIDFREFTSALAVLLKGTPEEKMKLAFRMFDNASVGYLEREDMEKMLYALSAVQGRKMELAKVKETVDSLLKKLRERAGHPVHRITLDDFIEFGTEHMELIEMFKAEDLVTAMQHSHIHDESVAHKPIKVSQVDLPVASGTTPPK